MTLINLFYSDFKKIFGNLCVKRDKRSGVDDKQGRFWAYYLYRTIHFLFLKTQNRAANARKSGQMICTYIKAINRRRDLLFS